VVDVKPVAKAAPKKATAKKSDTSSSSK